MKRCIKCGQAKPLAEFNVRSANKTDGRRARCRECQNRENREYKAAHRVRIRAKSREGYAANPEKHRERQRRTNATPERKAYYRTYGRAHPEAHRFRTQTRRARKRNAPGSSYTKPQHIRWRWEMWGNRCWVCGDVATQTDHVIPLAKGGSHWPSNLRPICGDCNRRKFTHTGGPLLKATVKEPQLFGE